MGFPYLIDSYVDISSHSAWLHQRARLRSERPASQPLTVSILPDHSVSFIEGYAIVGTCIFLPPLTFIFLNKQRFPMQASPLLLHL